MQFLKKYKEDIISIIVISATFLTISILYGRYFSNIIIDLGRELLFPELLLKGKLLYKDIFNLFGPLGYQLNAIWYYLFGVKITTLQVVGNVCAMIALYALYAISRTFFNPILGCSVSLVIIASAVFATSVFNFIFPYSYSILYAYIFILLSIVFFLLAFKNESRRNIYFLMAYFFAGASLSSKYEYLPYIFILLFYSVFVFKSSLKNALCYILSFLIVPTISFGSLLCQGVTINDIYQNCSMMVNYITSESLKYFYSNLSGTYFSFNLFKNFNINDLILNFVFIVFTYLVFDEITQKNRVKWIKSEYITFLLGLLFIAMIKPTLLFIFFPYVLYIFLICALFAKIRRKNFDLKNDIIFAFLLISISCGLKTAFILNVNAYGSFSLGLEYIAIIALCMEYLPKVTTFFKSTDVRKFFVVYSILVFIFFVGSIYNYSASRRANEIKSPKGSIYDYYHTSLATKNLLTYIKRHTKKDESLLVIPEGVMINYLSDRDIKLPSYYCLLPQHIAIFGVDNVIKNIDESDINYIVLNNRKYKEYGGTRFICDKELEALDYIEYRMSKPEARLCKYILNNYEKVKEIGAEFNYSVYKKLK